MVINKKTSKIYKFWVYRLPFLIKFIGTVLFEARFDGTVLFVYC